MFGEGNSPVRAPERPLVDPFGRAITYLRVSVTDRCDFRCVYCMAEDMTFLPKNEVLSLEEIDRIASAFIRRGTRKLRLTGGEPLVRRGIIDLVNSLGRHLKTGALEELTLTSNGSQMARHAEALFAAGVRRVNISLDTLDAEKFARITRWGRLPQVLDGIAAATAAGLKVKLNTVALAHENADEIEGLMQFAAAGGHDLTLIETMPLGEIGELVPIVSRRALGEHAAGEPVHDGRLGLVLQRLGQDRQRPDRRLELVAHVRHELALERRQPALHQRERIGLLLRPRRERTKLGFERFEAQENIGHGRCSHRAGGSRRNGWG
mgnify:CR=1 FL=1